jgi:sRNA-binding protein
MSHFKKGDAISVQILDKNYSVKDAIVVRVTKTKVIVNIDNGFKITDFRLSDLSSMTDHNIFEAYIV